MIKLPDSELEIMQAIWVLHEDGEEQISTNLIMKRFPAISKWKLTTVLTLISRLALKGFIETEKINRTNCYTPIISHEEYKKFIAKDFCERVYVNDRISLISAIVDSDNITVEELEEIKKIIQTKQNKENK